MRRMQFSRLSAQILNFTRVNDLSEFSEPFEVREKRTFRAYGFYDRYMTKEEFQEKYEVVSDEEVLALSEESQS